MDDPSNRLRNPAFLLRAALVLVVLALIFGPYGWRATVPIWIPFLILAGLEVQFFLGAFRAAPPPSRDRGPQPDRPRALRLSGRRRGRGRRDEEKDWEDDELDEEDEFDEPEPAVFERRRPLGRLLVGLAVLGALGLVLWIADSRGGWDGLGADTRAEATARFSAEASRIAGKPVTIDCDESREHVGVVQHADGAAIVGGDVAYLTPEICLALYRVAFKGEAASSRTARALAVLAHESWHLRGVANEGTTECYAFQSGVGLGQRLGVSEERARQMMRQQLAENALRGGRAVEYRVPPDCRDGGELDLDPASSTFP